MSQERKDQQYSGQLHKLRELHDFEISPNNPDVRGWTLIGLDGERIGKVDELIVDTEARKVRYLEVSVDKDVAQGDNHHILIPIGAARLHKNDDNVLIEGISRSTVHKYPMFDGQTITPEYERLLRRSMSADDTNIGTQASNSDLVDGNAPDRSVSQARLDEMQAELETQKVDQQRARQEQTNRSATWVANPTDATPATEARGTDPRSYRALEDALRVALAERDVALKERDIARAERDIVRMERDRALAAQQSTTYHHEQFDESKFYENRRSRES